jgi:hypothetical protein
MTATTLIQHLEGVGQAEPARGQQHGQVVEHVGGLLGHALFGLGSGGARDLLGLLLDLGPDQLGVGQQRRGVAARGIGAAPLGDGPL